MVKGNENGWDNPCGIPWIALPACVKRKSEGLVMPRTGCHGEAFYKEKVQPVHNWKKNFEAMMMK